MLYCTRPDQSKGLSPVWTPQPPKVSPISDQKLFRGGGGSPIGGGGGVGEGGGESDGGGVTPSQCLDSLKGTFVSFDNIWNTGILIIRKKSVFLTFFWGGGGLRGGNRDWCERGFFQDKEDFEIWRISWCCFTARRLKKKKKQNI